MKTSNCMQTMLGEVVILFRDCQLVILAPFSSCLWHSSSVTKVNGVNLHLITFYGSRDILNLYPWAVAVTMNPSNNFIDGSSRIYVGEIWCGAFPRTIITRVSWPRFSWAVTNRRCWKDNSMQWQKLFIEVKQCKSFCTLNMWWLGACVLQSPRSVMELKM